MSNIIINLDASSSDMPVRMAIGPADLQATEVSTKRRPVSKVVPASIDLGQAYYWSHVWQQGERESRAELEAGQKKTFDNAEDAIRWLLSGED